MADMSNCQSKSGSLSVRDSDTASGTNAINSKIPNLAIQVVVIGLNI